MKTEVFTLQESDTILGEPGALIASLIFKRTLISGDKVIGRSNRYKDIEHSRTKEVIVTVIGRCLICSFGSTDHLLFIMFLVYRDNWMLVPSVKGC